MEASPSETSRPKPTARPARRARGAAFRAPRAAAPAPPRPSVPAVGSTPAEVAAREVSSKTDAARPVGRARVRPVREPRLRFGCLEPLVFPRELGELLAKLEHGGGRRIGGGAADTVKGRAPGGAKPAPAAAATPRPRRHRLDRAARSRRQPWKRTRRALHASALPAPCVVSRRLELVGERGCQALGVKAQVAVDAVPENPPRLS